MRRFAIGMILAVLMAVPAVAADTAAPDTTTKIPTGVPIMNGHRFAPVPQLRGPFIQTFLRNTLGIASASDISIPPVNIGGIEFEGLKGDLKSAILKFEYQLALKRWLAIRGEVGITGRSGTGVQTLLAEGVTTSFDFELGWIFNLYRGELTRLTGTLDISNRSVSSISIFNLVSDIVSGTSYGLSRTTPVLSGQAGLQFAWAASPLLGVLANSSAGNGDSLDRSVDSIVYFSLGLGLSFDLDRYRVPMSVTLSTVADNRKSKTNAESGVIWESGVRVSYIGREAFLISLDLNRVWVPDWRYLEAFSGTRTGLSLTYYF